MSVYKIEEIAEIIRPIAENYKVDRVCLFGSYARGEAAEVETDRREIYAYENIMNINMIWKTAVNDIPVLRKFCEAQLEAFD